MSWARARILAQPAAAKMLGLGSDRYLHLRRAHVEFQIDFLRRDRIELFGKRLRTYDRQCVFAWIVCSPVENSDIVPKTRAIRCRYDAPELMRAYDATQITSVQAKNVAVYCFGDG